MKLFLPILLLLMPGCTTSIVEQEPSIDSKEVSLAPSLPEPITTTALGLPPVRLCSPSTKEEVVAASLITIAAIIDK